MHITKKKNERGITLVVLVITIIILIILATVSINAVIGENGLIQSAKNSKYSAENAVAQETGKMNSLLTEYANVMAEDAEITQPGENPNPGGDDKPEEPEDDEPSKSGIEDAIESGESFPESTTVKDDLENEVVIPGGFHLAEDSGKTVEEGIVIEDEYGNQFVWIPTGEYNVSKSISSAGKITNNLSRRTFTSSGATEISGDNAIDKYWYGEGRSTSSSINKQIDAFKTSAKSKTEGGNGGFYIGRFEQGEGNVCKLGENPSINITKDQAKSQAESMYNGNNYVVSELISSYAWDTVLNFISQTNIEGYILTTTQDKKYGNLGTNSISLTGMYQADNYSNIHDIIGNVCEWTTEYSSLSDANDVNRGGIYGGYFDSIWFAANRNHFTNGTKLSSCGFRIQLYIK